MYTQNVKTTRVGSDHDVRLEGQWGWDAPSKGDDVTYAVDLIALDKPHNRIIARVQGMTLSQALAVANLAEVALLTGVEVTP